MKYHIIMKTTKTAGRRGFGPAPNVKQRFVHPKFGEYGNINKVGKIAAFGFHLWSCFPSPGGGGRQSREAGRTRPLTMLMIDD